MWAEYITLGVELAQNDRTAKNNSVNGKLIAPKD